MAVARADPPNLVTGDLVDQVAALVQAAPVDATVVVFHSAVLNYLPPEDRARFVATVTDLPCRWVANEGFGVAVTEPDQLPATPDPDTGWFVLSLDGVPLAHANPHGASLHWFGPATIA